MLPVPNPPNNNLGNHFLDVKQKIIIILYYVVVAIMSPTSDGSSSFRSASNFE
jgi:hypothetical protein